MRKFIGLILVIFFVCSFSKIALTEPKKVFAYITNTASNTVIVIDTKDNQIKATIPVGNHPWGAAVTPNGKKVYVANRGDIMVSSNIVSVINIDKLTDPPVTITVGTRPRGVVISPDGKKAYVTNGGSNTVSVIDTTDDTKTPDSITVGQTPTGIAITPNGKIVYIANDDSDSISVIRTSDDQVIKTITDGFRPGSSPQHIAITPDGKKAYVANGGDSAVAIIDIAEGSQNENKVIKTFFLNPRDGACGIAANPDGKSVYATNCAGTTVSVINTQDDTQSDPITVGNGPHGVAFTPDGKRAYVTNKDNSTVSVIDTKTKEVITITGFNAPETFGNFITPLPIVKVSNSEVTFPSQGPDPSNAVQTITLTNSGNGILDISNIEISGNFSQTNNCGSSLTAYASCTITVTLLKTDGSVQSGDLTVTTNASDDPTVIPVRGSVAPPAVGAGGCNLAQQNNLKIGSILFLISFGFLFLLRRNVKN